MNNQSVIEEASSIKDELLEIQRQIEHVNQETEDNLLLQIKKENSDDDVVAIADLVDNRVHSKVTILSPKLLNTRIPVSINSAKTIRSSRNAIKRILKRSDNRLVVIVGPCAIHDAEAAIEYAKHLLSWREQYKQDLEIIMRTYVEKPRSEKGWKGYIYDPLLNDSNDINLGLIATRLLSRRITDMGVPIAVERLNALTPQYLNSLVAYDVIGARNTTDQKAREYASATSCPVGFKNTPEGSIEFAAQAIVAASGKHAFLGIDEYGATKQINSVGNDLCHIILRGASNGPNYSPSHIALTKQILKNKLLPDNIVVDASHGNSGKKAMKQIEGIRSVCQQIKRNEHAIRGVMIESNLVHGNQKLTSPDKLKYGLSIVDECVDIVETDRMLAMLAEASAIRAKSESSSSTKPITTTNI